MNKRRFQRAVLLTGFTGLLLLGGYGTWLFQAQRHQYALDRQLIAALVKRDTHKAFALVNQGADPNTPYYPPSAPSFQQFWDYLLHGEPLSTPSPISTAFLMACGEYSVSAEDYVQQNNRPDDPRLVQAMLEHGAQLTSKDSAGWPPLQVAAGFDHVKTVSVLLSYGANVNAENEFGETALVVAVDGDASKTMLRLLLDNGADPNLPDKEGLTLIQRDRTDSDLMALLRQHGAKK